MASANLPPEALHSPWSEHDQFLTPDKPPDKLAGEPRHGTAEDALRTSSSSGAALLNRTFEPEKEYENGKEYGILAENGAQGRVELELELEPDAPLDDSNPDDADDNGKNKIPVDFWPRVAYQTREFFYPSAITEPPRITKPLLGKYSIKLVKLFERLPKWANYLLLFLFYFAWAATIVTITYFSTYHSQVIPYAGDDPVDPQWIGCYASLWSRNSGCGVNGANCEPFTNASFALRCSPKCLLAKTGEQYWIGNTTVNKQPVIVGSGPYRGDSWLCMAAMHSGLVTDRSGGCMVVELAGEADYFEGSSRYGVSSSTFPSQFPKSFNVKPCFESPNCADLAWASLTALGIFAFFASTLTPSPSSLFFYTLSLLGFFWVVFGDYSSPRADSNFLSKAFAQVLPTLAVSYALYQTVVRTVLPPLVATHGLDVFIFYILPYILGLDLVELLTYLPDLTLTAKALQDPAQIGMLVGSVVIIGGFGVYFLYWQRKLRRLPWMVLLYGVFFAFFFSVPLIFNLYPHLHH